MKKFFKRLVVLFPLVVVAPTIPSDETGISGWLCFTYSLFVFVIWLIIRSRRRNALLPNIIRRDELRAVVEQQKKRRNLSCEMLFTSITSNEKGFGVGKALVGLGLIGLPGSIAETLGVKIKGDLSILRSRMANMR